MLTPMALSNPTKPQIPIHDKNLRKGRQPQIPIHDKNLRKGRRRFILFANVEKESGLKMKTTEYKPSENTLKKMVAI